VLRAFDRRRLGLKLPGWELDTSFRTARIHHNSNPQRIWAVQITPNGALWAEAELAGLTKTKVRVRYSDELALLNRNSTLPWHVPSLSFLNLAGAFLSKKTPRCSFLPGKKLPGATLRQGRGLAPRVCGALRVLADAAQKRACSAGVDNHSR
jgi:hypothetical protein